MRFFILLASLAVTATAIKTSELGEKCRKEANVTKETFNSFVNNDFLTEPPKEFKCYLKCLMENMNLLVDGEYKAPDIPETQSHQRNIMEICRDKKGADYCETAYLITKCYKDNYKATQN